MTLSQLIAAVERAEGASRELDAEICRAAGPWRQQPDGSWITYRKDGYTHSLNPPAVTASLDAAMALVPEGCWAEGALSSPAALEIHAPMTYDPLGKGWAATPALGLCAAALRAHEARAAMEGR